MDEIIVRYRAVNHRMTRIGLKAILCRLSDLGITPRSVKVAAHGVREYLMSDATIMTIIDVEAIIEQIKSVEQSL